MESKKKNMMRRETEAPRGRHIACRESRVVTLCSLLFSSSPSSPTPFPSSIEMDRKDPYTMRRMEMKKVETREESIIEYARWKVSAEGSNIIVIVIIIVIVFVIIFIIFMIKLFAHINIYLYACMYIC